MTEGNKEVAGMPPNKGRVSLREALAQEVGLGIEGVPLLDSSYSDMDELGWGERTPLREALRSVLERGEMETDELTVFADEVGWPSEFTPIDCAVEFSGILLHLLGEMPNRRHDATGELVRAEMLSPTVPQHGEAPPDNEGWSFTGVVRAELQVTLGLHRLRCRSAELGLAAASDKGRTKIQEMMRADEAAGLVCEEHGLQPGPPPQ